MITSGFQATTPHAMIRMRIVLNVGSLGLRDSKKRSGPMDKLLIKDLKCLPDKITSHLDPVFFEDKNSWLNTDREQKAFGEGNNHAIDSIGEVDIRDFVKVCDCVLNSYEAAIDEKCQDCHGSGIVPRKG